MCSSSPNVKIPVTFVWTYICFNLVVKKEHRNDLIRGYKITQWLLNCITFLVRLASITDFLPWIWLVFRSMSISFNPLLLFFCSVQNSIYIVMLENVCNKLINPILYMSRCVLEPPVLPADLFVLSPGYEVPPDLATVPHPLVYTFCGSRCLQHRFECSEWCCWHRDIKRVISCRNDIMNLYKRSRPDRNVVLCLLTANWTVSRVCPTVCSPGTVLEVLTVILVK